jgi:hypothetical protein
LSYRELLGQLRSVQGLGKALWLPLPWWLMRLTAKLLEALPQRVVSADGMQVLQAGLTTEHNEALYWLRQMPKPAVALTKSASIATNLIVDTR